jgi:hypothetical protein
MERHKTTLIIVLSVLLGMAAFAQKGFAQASTPGEPAFERKMAQDWLDLFLELAFVAPSELQQGTISQAWALHDKWLRSPANPTAAARRQLLSDCEAHYARLKKLHPPVMIAKESGGFRVEPEAEPLRLTRGLESIVLVEVTNRTSMETVVHVSFAESAGAPKGPVRIPPGQSRVSWARVKPTQTGTIPAVLSMGETLPDGKTVKLNVRTEVGEPARLRGILTEAGSDQPVPARIHLLAADGLLRRDNQFGTNDTLSAKPLLNFLFSGRGASYTLPFVYTDGRIDVLLPPGKTRLTMERGFEHPLTVTNLVLRPGETREITVGSQRFIDMRSLGWVSGDTHIHWAKNWWSEDEDIRLLAMVQRAEDVRVANNLTLKHHTTNQNFIAPTQFPMGPIPGYCSADWHMEMAEEYRNEEFYGHLIFLNLKRLVQPISTGFMGGPPFWDYPHNLPAILEAHEQGGAVIEAHGLGNDADVPANVAHELADSLDQIEPDDYYRFLECGFQLPLSNGSDHPARVVGCARVYVKTRLPFSYANWIDGLRQNRTFTTSGPLLFLEVNGREVGDVIEASPDTPLKIKARAVSRYPLGRVQLVSNGKVLAEKKTDACEAELVTEIAAGEPRWIVARCSDCDSFSAIMERNIAHTAGIYVTVNGKQRFAPEAAREWVVRLRRHGENIRRTGRFPTPENRDEAADYVFDAVRIYTAAIERHEQGLSANALSPATRELFSQVRARAVGWKINATDRNALANLERYGESGAREVIERIQRRCQPAEAASAPK